MSENSRQYIKALCALQAVATRVPDDAWDNPSCCSDWTAREDAVAQFIAFTGRRTVSP